VIVLLLDAKNLCRTCQTEDQTLFGLFPDVLEDEFRRDTHHIIQYRASIAGRVSGGRKGFASHVTSIFDTFGKSIVSLSRSALHPTERVRLAAEFNKILHGLMTFMHVKSFEFCFCFADWIVGSEICFEFPQ